MSVRKQPRVAIVGAGMSGICMAIKLQGAGIDSFVIFEEGTEVGGTWRDNTYPGLECDVPSRYYSYSFRPNPEWSRVMPPRNEIQQYLLDVTDEYGLRSHIRDGRVKAVAPTETATKLYNEQIKAALPHTTWASGCNSWYLGKDGLPEVFPWVPERHSELLRSPVVTDFDVQPA